MQIDCIDSSGAIKNADFYATLVLEHVDKLQLQKQLVQVLFDGGIQGADRKIKDVYPHVTVGICTTHTLNLCMQDLVSSLLYYGFTK